MLEARADAVSNGRGRLWMKTSKEREGSGRCVTDLRIKTEFKKGIILLYPKCYISVVLMR